MRFSKPPLPLAQQVQLLQQRGMQVADPAKAEQYLGSIGYYRLSAYSLPFETAAPAGQPRQHQFKPGTTFEQMLSLYVFDRKLRVLVIEAIERIEVSVRTRWAYAVAMRHGAHAHMQAELFKSPWQHTQDLARMATEIDQNKGKEAFVSHYRKTYSEPFLPPIWAVVETMTLGVLSRWVENTKDNSAKKEVAAGLGMPTVEVLEQVLHAMTPVRNACAHHCRLWNRRWAMSLPYIKRYKDSLVPPGGSGHQAHLLYNYLTVLAAMMQHMNPSGTWAERLAALLNEELEPHFMPAMGFPADWATRPLWHAGAAA